MNTDNPPRRRRQEPKSQTNIAMAEGENASRADLRDARRQVVRDRAACPKCKVKRGEYCLRVNGGLRISLHEERWKAAGIKYHRPVRIDRSTLPVIRQVRVANARDYGEISKPFEGLIKKALTIAKQAGQIAAANRRDKDARRRLSKRR